MHEEAKRQTNKKMWSRKVHPRNSTQLDWINIVMNLNIETRKNLVFFE